jgi:putative transposase
MPKKGHSEEQIIAALKQYEAGEKMADICRKLSVSQASFYLWKKQHAGQLGVQELRELRQLRDKNSRLKRLVADLSLDRQILQEIVSKKLVSDLGPCTGKTCA